MKIKNSLPVLDAILNFSSSFHFPDLNKIVIVSVQHVITTTSHLFAALIRLGISPENIFVLGKQYSTLKTTHDEMAQFGIKMQPLSDLQACGRYEETFKKDIANMWQRVKTHLSERQVNAILVLDDGGRCLESIPDELIEQMPVIGIEQTTAGLFNPKVLSLPVPFIDVATCAAKKNLESSVISQEIISSVDKYLTNPDLIYGVVGYGTIGKAVVNRLLSLNLKVVVYDPFKTEESDSVIMSENISQLMEVSDYIFGCSGRDITQEIDPADFMEDKTFISCSSEDKEFYSLLTTINNLSDKIIVNPLSDIHYTNEHSAKISILNGGFPINFNRTCEMSMANNIQLTRGLIFCALIQAACYLNQRESTACRLMLSPKLQQLVVSKLSGTSDFWEPSIINQFNDVDWIMENSNGNYFEYSLPHLAPPCLN